MGFRTTPDFTAPDSLRTAEFQLRPLRATDDELDYAAVMESREQLRTWSQSEWPADDFTVAANRADLAEHERQHLAHEAYTYTVLNPDGSECLGCVYIFPPAARTYTQAQITAPDGDDWATYDAVIYFWARQSRLADGLDQRLVMALDAWFNDAWQMPRHLFMANAQLTQQVAMLEGAGFRRTFRLDGVHANGATYFAYSRG